MRVKKRFFVFLAIINIIAISAILIANKQDKSDKAAETTETVVKEYVYVTPIPSTPAVLTKQDLGEFKITYYCSCFKCCGKNDGITRSGATVKEGVTVAVDKDVIPLGSYLYIEGLGYRIAQDTGSAINGNDIDVYIKDHQEALEKGVETRKVYLLN